MNVDSVIKELNESGLKGMGGAGFPSGQKWKFVRMEPGPRLMTINGDEGEPGTFKDKLYLEQNMHKFFEGMLIAAWAVEAKKIYIYMRDEYPGIRLKMIDELKKLSQTDIIDPDTKTVPIDSKGRRSYGTSTSYCPSIGKHVVMGYLPKEIAYQGKSLSLEYFNDNGDGLYPMTVQIVGKGSLYDPTNSRVRI